MAWYNSIGIGGGNGPGPGEIAWAQYNAEQARKAQEESARAEAVAKGTAARTSAGELARGQASKYFSDRGLDPNEYSGDIDSRINDLLSTVNPTEEMPGQYLRDIGQYVADARTTAGRDKANMSLSSVLPQGYDRGRIGDTFDDSFISSAEGAQRGKADSYIDNLLKRGVITATGAGGARANLDAQGGRVRSQLDTLGQGLLSEGRQQLTDVGTRARTNASTLALGQSFDPNMYGKQLDDAYNDFSSKFGDKFASSVPDNLFDTSGLATAAGVASGAQNTKYDPNALAGRISPDQQPNPEDPTKKKATALF